MFILGDSLAVSLGVAVNRIYQPGCAVIGKVGATTSDIGRVASAARGYRTIVISAGSNDAANAGLAGALETLRRRVKATRIVWIYPYDRRAALTVSRIALRYNDRVIDVAPFVSADGVHPVSYFKLARLLVR